MKCVWLSMAAALVVSASPLAVAEEPAVPEALQRTLDTALAGQQPDEVTETPVPGLYQVSFGAHVFYFSASGEYMLRGEMIDLQEGTNLTKQAQSDARSEILNDLDEESLIVFAPEAKKVAHTVTIFTDIDCPYCQKLHREIDQYTQKGIKVRYALYPRAGEGSSSFDKAVSVWCADDRKKALTRAKGGEPVPERQCDNPVADQHELGKRLGVQGTPYIVAEDGRAFPGYIPAQHLARLLEGKGSGLASAR